MKAVHSETGHTDTPNFLLAQKSCQGRCCDGVVPLPTGGQGINLVMGGGIAQPVQNTALRLSFAFVRPSAHMAAVGIHSMSEGGVVSCTARIVRPTRFSCIVEAFAIPWRGCAAGISCCLRASSACDLVARSRLFFFPFLLVDIQDSSGGSGRPAPALRQRRGGDMVVRRVCGVPTEDTRDAVTPEDLPVPSTTGGTVDLPKWLRRPGQRGCGRPKVPTYTSATSIGLRPLYCLFCAMRYDSRARWRFLAKG